MDSYTRMIAQLKATRLYRLDDSTLIEAEMKAYAKILRMLFEQAEAILKDCFLDEVESPRGEYFEELFGLPKTIFPLTEEKRLEREYKIRLMKQRMAVTNQDFNAEAIKKAIETGGMKVTFSENPSTKTVTVTVMEDTNMLATEQEKKDFIRMLIPFHSSITYNMLES